MMKFIPQPCQVSVMQILEVFWIFLKLGCTSFGGPIAHLGYFRESFVIKYKWLSEAEYANLVSISQIIPGPASSQVGFAIGFNRAGFLGAIAAFIGFTLPSVLLLIIFASQSSLVDSQTLLKIVNGLAIVAFVVVFQAVIGMGKQLLNTNMSWVLAVSVGCITLLSQNIYIQLFSILGAAIISVLGGENIEQKVNLTEQSNSLNLNRFWSVGSALLFISIGFLQPFIDSLIYSHASAFFVSGAMVFGGGHVVLPFLEATIVNTGLVDKSEFFTGYGLTQAMPGPMFSFAAYLGYSVEANNSVFFSYQGLFSALMATLFVFLPGFLLLLVALSITSSLLNKPIMVRAFNGANAAVVGLLAATLYHPIFNHAITNNTNVVIAALALVGLLKFRLPVLSVVLFCAVTSFVFI